MMKNTGNKIRNMECFTVFILISDIATTNYLTKDVDKNHKNLFQTEIPLKFKNAILPICSVSLRVQFIR